MESSGLVYEGFSLMLFGMGFVFVFLTLLVFATTWMSKCVQRFWPAPTPQTPAPSSASAPAGNASNDAQLMAVLSAAVHKFRSRHK